MLGATNSPNANSDRPISFFNFPATNGTAFDFADAYLAAVSTPTPTPTPTSTPTPSPVGPRSPSYLLRAKNQKL
jgi:hypothetical protein